jgi:hypothetical protein
MADSPISPKDFGASFKGFMEQMAQQARAEEPFFRRRLREHFGSDPATQTIQTFTSPLKRSSVHPGERSS